MDPFAEQRATTPLGLLPAGAWFEMDYRGRQQAAGQKVYGDMESDCKVRLTRRWGKPVKEEQGWSCATRVYRAEPPTEDDSPDAVAAVAPEWAVAPQEELVDASPPVADLFAEE